jgi:hypothetical protein
MSYDSDEGTEWGIPEQREFIGPPSPAQLRSARLTLLGLAAVNLSPARESTFTRAELLTEAMGLWGSTGEEDEDDAHERAELEALLDAGGHGIYPAPCQPGRLSMWDATAAEDEEEDEP